MLLLTQNGHCKIQAPHEEPTQSRKTQRRMLARTSDVRYFKRIMLAFTVTDPVLQFTMLITVSLIVQLTVERLHLPGLIGLLLIGMILGPGGANVLPREPMLDLLGSIGLIYVMFMAGTEINFSTLRTHPHETVMFGLGSFFFSLIPAMGVALLMGWGWAGALLLGAVISSHTLLAYTVVAKLGLVRRRSVVAAIGGTLITDTLALVLLAVVIQIHSAEAATHPLESLIPLGLLVVVVGVSLAVVPKMSRWIISRKISQAQKALYVLAVLLVLASITELIGTEKILGAFLAGLCLNSMMARREILREHVGFVGRMLFIPFFFVSTGTLLEISVFTESVRVWGIAAMLLGMVAVGKASATWAVGSRFLYPWRDRLLLFSLTIPQAAATLAVTITARDAGVFDDIVVDAVIVLIFITCLVGPLLTQRVGLQLSRQDSIDG